MSTEQVPPEQASTEQAGTLGHVMPPTQAQWQSSLSQLTITGATPPAVADEVVRRRADVVARWASGGAGLFAVFTFFVWLSVLSPGKDLVVSQLGEIGAWVIGLCGMISVIGLGFSVYKLLQVMRDRATYTRPLLSRTATEIHTMHMWPVKNIPGPVMALKESGSTAVMGPGRIFWYLSCVLWPVAVGWLIAADVARTYFQAGIITVLAFATTAITARLLSHILAPEEVHRHIPVGTGREKVEPGFWSKGFIPSENADKSKAAGAGAVDKRLFEGTAGNFVDDFYK